MGQFGACWGLLGPFLSALPKRPSFNPPVLQTQLSMCSLKAAQRLHSRLGRGQTDKELRGGPALCAAAVGLQGDSGRLSPADNGANPGLLVRSHPDPQ